jgi:transposase InsO family protein
MVMTYETNSRLPRLRMEAVRLVQAGHGVRQVARYFGYTPGAISKWLERARQLPSNSQLIPTRSSRPHHHPKELSSEIVGRILRIRAERNQCAEIIHHKLAQEGVRISLSSVKRTLKRFGISRYSRWKKWHQYPPRPFPEKPGILVEIDTIVDGLASDRLYVYTLIDVYSRMAQALATERINTHRSLKFVENTQELLPFELETIQSDHGAEFSKWFTKRILERGLIHRHSRVRMPSDNGHLERFNRTLQEECLGRIPRSLKSWQKEIPKYLNYYNQERPHMGLGMKTPADIIKCFQAID